MRLHAETESEPEMNPMVSDASALARRIGRAMPSVAIVAVLATALAALTGEMANLALAGTIPAVAFFIVTRALLLVPRPTDEQRRQSQELFNNFPLPIKVIVWGVAVGCFIIPGLSLSAALFLAVGMKSTSAAWMIAAVVSAALVPCCGVAVAIFKHFQLLFETADLRLVPVAGCATLQLLYLPTKIADHLFSYHRSLH